MQSLQALDALKVKRQIHRQEGRRRHIDRETVDDRRDERRDALNHLVLRHRQHLLLKLSRVRRPLLEGNEDAEGYVGRQRVDGQLEQDGRARRRVRAIQEIQLLSSATSHNTSHRRPANETLTAGLLESTLSATISQGPKPANQAVASSALDIH